MRAVIQRVSNAHVEVDGKTVSKIGHGIVTLLGIAQGDTEEHARRLIRKIIELRIFEDDAGKMNCSLQDVRGEHLIVSQFTLAADTSSGKRPSFTSAARPEPARALYDLAVRISTEAGVNTATGVFQADMKIHLVNDGPATFVLDA